MLRSICEFGLYDGLAFFCVFVPCFCMVILSLPFLGLGSKSTSVSPGFCVCRPRQYNAICWKLDLISGFFVFFLVDFFQQIESAGLFQKAGDADSKGYTRTLV